MKFAVEVCEGCGCDLTEAEPVRVIHQPSLTDAEDTVPFGDCPQCHAQHQLIESDEERKARLGEPPPAAAPAAEAVAPPAEEPAAAPGETEPGETEPGAEAGEEEGD